MSEKKLNLKQIADYLDGKIIGNEDCEVRNILPLDLANEEDISFLYSKKFIDKLKTTKAKVVVLEEKYINALYKAAPNMPYQLRARATGTEVRTYPEGYKDTSNFQNTLQLVQDMPTNTLWR